jgi:hypothetical protein
MRSLFSEAKYTDGLTGRACCVAVWCGCHTVAVRSRTSPALRIAGSSLGGRCMFLVASRPSPCDGSTVSVLSTVETSA